MHPAFSVIFFTVSSGAGYGLLAVMGIIGAEGMVPLDPWVGGVGFGLAFAAITLGLLSSTFHLGHPERAWRAFSQWRSSWLSREGVAAVLTYIPAVLFAYSWIVRGDASGLWGLAGWLAAFMAGVTVFCTGMIYRSLKTIPQWSNGWVVPGYLILGLVNGLVWFNAVLVVLDWGIREITIGALWGLIAVSFFKTSYWRHIDQHQSETTVKTATGLGASGPVKHFEGPHTEENYLLQEMGYKVARKHAEKLRQMVTVPGLGGAVGCVAVAMLVGGFAAVVLSVAAAFLTTAAMAIERWLFFAEAKHVVTLYYHDEASG